MKLSCCISVAFPLHSVQVLSDSWLQTVKPPHLRWLSVRDCLLTLRCDLLRLAVSADACVCTKKARISLDLIIINPDDSGKLCWSLSFNHVDIKFYCADAAAQCPRPMFFSASQWFHGMLKAIDKLLMLWGVGPSQSEATIPTRLVEVSAGWPLCRLADDASNVGLLVHFFQRCGAAKRQKFQLQKHSFSISEHDVIPCVSPFAIL